MHLSAHASHLSTHAHDPGSHPGHPMPSKGSRVDMEIQEMLFPIGRDSLVPKI